MIRFHAAFALRYHEINTHARKRRTSLVQYTKHRIDRGNTPYGTGLIIAGCNLEHRSARRLRCILARSCKQQQQNTSRRSACDSIRPDVG